MIEIGQIKLVCPRDGQTLWSGTREVYQVGGGAVTRQKIPPYCAKCEPAKHLDLLRNAVKITPITEN